MNNINLIFKKTCDCCPEQYDVYYNDKQVGYIRLRWGHLSCECPDIGGDCVYEFDLDDDLSGCFDDDTQREIELNNCGDKIIEWMKKNMEYECR